jgi:ferredoxin--NADP+ reductase
MNKGDCILNVTGPLGVPSEIARFGNVLCLGGGVMIAPLLLQTKAFREAGNTVTAIIGARIKSLLFYKDELRAASNRFFVATDDGSEGHKGLEFLKEILEKNQFNRCIVMGPLVMMKEVSALTKPYGIPTVVNLVPIMVDGMGMCGVCRVTVDGKMKFGCLDGPEFDGHKVDYEELVNRQRMFLPEERLSSLVWETLGECSCDRKQT